MSLDDTRETYAHRSEAATDVLPKEKQKRMSRAEIINAWLTAMIFLATAASAYFFYKQWKEMQGTAAQTERIISKSQEQIDQTIALASRTGELRDQQKRSADAAEASLNAVNSNFVNEERPYIAVTKQTPNPAHPKVEENFDPVFNIEYRNFGRSAAIDTRSRSHVFFGENIKGKIIDFFKPVPITGGSKVTVPPAGAADPNPPFISARAGRLASDKEATFVAANDYALAIVAVIEYRDAKGNKYSERYCTLNLVTGAFQYCPDDYYGIPEKKN